MADWTKSMQQTFEYYEVDPGTWQDKRLLTNVKKSTINRDSEVETRGSATIDVTESVGECYIRVYLITIQNGVKERHPLGTFLVQTPNSSFDGYVRNVTMDAYTPLLELKENPPDIGYFVPKTDDVAQAVYRLTREHVRAPVVRPAESSVIGYDFVADTSDTWLSYLTDLLTNIKYHFDLDELGRIIFVPDQDIKSLRPVWTFDDSNSSILYPELNMDHDLYGIPNVVEVCYFNSETNQNVIVRAKNTDVNSPTSIPRRGREIIYRVTSPDLPGIPTKVQLQDYADQLLKALSSIEYTISFTHGYCPVRVGDAVRLNYERAGIKNVKAKIISQSIKCEPGCPVTAKAVFTTNLWG